MYNGDASNRTHLSLVGLVPIDVEAKGRPTGALARVAVAPSSPWRTTSLPGANFWTLATSVSKLTLASGKAGK